MKAPWYKRLAFLFGEERHQLFESLTEEQKSGFTH